MTTHLALDSCAGLDMQHAIAKPEEEGKVVQPPQPASLQTRISRAMEEPIAI